MKNAELLLILVIVIVVASLLQGNILNKNKTKVIKNNFPTPTITSSPTPTVVISPTATVYKKNSIPTPIQGSTNSGQDINSYKYPNSSVKEENSSKLLLESSDDPNTITNWYKEKLRSLNMNVNSFVTTKSNGTVLNKLVSANGEVKVSIEISKTNNQSSVEIIVSIN